MSKGKLIGHIDCPVCGTTGGMRITEDKNGEPFGYCEAECDAQLRIGGKVRRVDKFYEHHKHLKRPTDAPPAAGGGAVTEAAAKADASATPPAKPAAPATPPAKPATPPQPPKLPGLGFSLGGLAK